MLDNNTYSLKMYVIWSNVIPLVCLRVQHQIFFKHLHRNYYTYIFTEQEEEKPGK
jgi:hypothetical protein